MPVAKVKPDNKAAVDFLSKWSKTGPWLITAIQVGGKAINTRSFTPKTKKALLAWLDEFNGKRNIYFHVNPVMKEMKKKAMEKDVKEVAWFHVDIDPRAEQFKTQKEQVAFLKKEQKRTLGLLTDKLPDGIPEPTVIIFSGGGHQGFWKLKKPIPINGDLKKVEDAKLYNLQLEHVFEGDHCHSLDHIMRLPGTVNIPDAKKKKKGRVPALAYVVRWNPRATYAEKTFAKATPPTEASEISPTIKLPDGKLKRYSVEDLDEWGVGNRLKVVLVQGMHPAPEEQKKGDNSRSAWLFDACCNLHRLKVPDEVIFSIITDPDFAISESVLEMRGNAEKYALRQIARAKEEAIEPWLRKLNERHCVIGNFGGKCRVIEDMYDHALKRPSLTKQSFDDFKNRYCNKKVKAGVDKEGHAVYRKLGHWWLDHPERKQKDTVIFAPGYDVENAYNLWKGFSCQSIEGDCDIFLDHVFRNVCQKDDGLFKYIMGWMARCVQKPNSQGESAIVLRGARGVGKSKFAKEFGSLFGRHFVHVFDPGHLVGNFNSHLRDAVVLFADEAFYAKDKQHKSILKGLITEETIMVTPKGVDTEASPNYVHLIMAANDARVIPAGPLERRFFMLDVGVENLQDTKFFGALDKQMNGGGREALLYHLQNYDISDFDVRTVPRTAALQEQTELNFSPEEDWWFARLQDGKILRESEEWPFEIAKDILQDDYLRYTEQFRINIRASSTSLGRFLKRVCPNIVSYQRRGEFQERNGSGQIITKKRRAYFYKLPSLEEARGSWNELYGDTIWPKLDDSTQVEIGSDGPPF